MIEYSEMRKAESGTPGALRPAPPVLRPRTPVAASLSAFRPGVTLVELLVTMTIMALIAAAIMGTASAALEHARRSRTQQLVTRIHELVMQHWASYQTRRIDLHPSLVQAINQRFPDTTPDSRRARGQALADLRLLGLRELMRYEMPDRFLDFGAISGSTAVLQPPQLLQAAPPLAQTYLRRAQQAGASIDNQDAECLFMVVMFATGDGEARTLFSNKDIADTDGDGLPEFIDGWGKAIGWVRWPAGFVSDLQPLDPATGRRNADADHDSFDPYRRDQIDVRLPDANQYPSPAQRRIQELRTRNNSGANSLGAYRLTPLIFSDGPDAESGIFRIPIGGAPDSLAFDPYRIVQNNMQYGFVITPDEAKDNIHNHLIEY